MTLIQLSNRDNASAVASAIGGQFHELKNGTFLVETLQNDTVFLWDRYGSVEVYLISNVLRSLFVKIIRNENPEKERITISSAITPFKFFNPQFFYTVTQIGFLKRENAETLKEHFGGQCIYKAPNLSQVYLWHWVPNYKSRIEIRLLTALGHRRIDLQVIQPSETESIFFSRLFSVYDWCTEKETLKLYQEETLDWTEVE